MYGTTSSGGKHGAGTVLAITTSGKETILYGFKGGSADGSPPSAPLINVSGTLYGTTYAGATTRESSSRLPVGKETVLYSFKGGSADGSNPVWGSSQRQRHTLRHDHFAVVLVLAAAKI